MKSRLLSVLLTGFALALGFLIAVQITQSMRSQDVTDVVSTAVTQEDLNKTVTPVLFKTISEQNGRLRLIGTAEANAVIVLQNHNENFRQIKTDQDGVWSTAIDVTENQALELSLLAFLDGNIEIRTEEVLYRVPAQPEPHDLTPSAYLPLIMVTTPGGPTRIIQSPFGGQPSAGPLSMGPVDYDARGSVIFSGQSKSAGTVKIYANRILIGQRPVEENGRWFFIAAESLPRGSYNIVAELTTEEGAETSIIVPFSRLIQSGSNAPTADAWSAARDPKVWQISRQLLGGGLQYTAVFAPPDPIEMGE